MVSEHDEWTRNTSIATTLLSPCCKRGERRSFSLLNSNPSFGKCSYYWRVAGSKNLKIQVISQYGTHKICPWEIQIMGWNWQGVISNVALPRCASQVPSLKKGSLLTGLTTGLHSSSDVMLAESHLNACTAQPLKQVRAPLPLCRTSVALNQASPIWRTAGMCKGPRPTSCWCKVMPNQALHVTMTCVLPIWICSITHTKLQANL